MADEIIKMLPINGSFGSMSQEQLLDYTRNPPAAEDVKTAADPMGMVQRPGMQLAAAASSSSIGKRAYHRKRKEECTIHAMAQGPDKVQVRWDNGDITTANLSNITLI